MHKKILCTLALVSSVCLALISCSESPETGSDYKQPAVQTDQISDQVLSGPSENLYKITKYKDIEDAFELYNIIMTADGRYFSQGCLSKSDEPVVLCLDHELNVVSEHKLQVPENVKKSDDYSDNLIFNADGETAVFYKFYDNNGVTCPDRYDESFDYESFYSNQKRYNGLCFYNTDGSIKNCLDFSTYEELSENGTDIYYDDLIMLDSDTVLFFFGMDNALAFGSDGSCKELSLPADEIYTRRLNFVHGSDGKPYVAISSQSSEYETCTYSIYEIDTEALKLKDPVYSRKLSVSDQFNGSDIITGYGDYLFICSNDQEVSGIRADGTSEPIFKWLDTDYEAMNILPAGDDEFYCWDMYGNYSEDKIELFKAVRRAPGELADRRIITVATFGSGNIDKYICKFNREQDKYRIQAKDYSQEFSQEELDCLTFDDIIDLYDEEYNALKLDIITGKAPDLLLLGRNDIVLLGQKGVLADLCTFMDNDPEVNRDTVVPNILKSLENSSGKLFSITPSFQVSTFAAKKKLADHENWTMQEMLSLFDSNDAEHRYDNINKYEMLDIILKADSDLVDTANSECHFDTPGFVEMLKFCDRFAEEASHGDKSDMASYEEYWRDRSRWLKDEKVLISKIKLTGNMDLVYDKNEFGEEALSFVGYPTSNGKGGKLVLGPEFSINAASSVKEGAWEFIKMIMKMNIAQSDDIYSQREDDWLYGYPVISEEFDKVIEGMSSVRYIDEDGNETVQTSFESQGRTIHVLSKDELKALKRYILSCDSLYDTMDSDVYQICYEEADAFFHGEITAEKAAENMQSRITLIVSEKG